MATKKKKSGAKKPRTAKQQAATRKLVALNKKRGGSNPSKKSGGGSRKSISVSQISLAPSRSQIGGTVAQLSQVATKVAITAAAVNIPAGVLSGRTIFSPGGELHDQLVSTAIRLGPRSFGDLSTRTLIDVSKVADGTVPLWPAAQGSKFRGVLQAMNYNARRGLGGKATVHVLGPLLLAGGVALANKMITPLAVDLIDSVGEAFPVGA